MTFNYGNGANGFIDVSAIQTVSAFTLTGSNLGTGNVVATLVSAEASISMDMGGMSGSAVIGTMNTDGDFTLNAGGAGNLNLNIEMISASGVAITLGAVSESSHANNISAIHADSVNINGAAYREIFTSDAISANAVTVSFIDLSVLTEPL